MINVSEINLDLLSETPLQILNRLNARICKRDGHKLLRDKRGNFHRDKYPKTRPPQTEEEKKILLRQQPKTIDEHEKEEAERLLEGTKFDRQNHIK